MKTIRGFMLISFLTAMMAISMPVSAQQTPTTGTERTENNNDNDNDRGNFGWIGLLGLIGLAGLARKSKDVPVNRTTNQPQTKYAP